MFPLNIMNEKRYTHSCNRYYGGHIIMHITNIMKQFIIVPQTF